MAVDHVTEEALGAIIEAQGQAGGSEPVENLGFAPESQTPEIGEASGPAGRMDVIQTYAGEQVNSSLMLGGEGVNLSKASLNKRKLAKVAETYLNLLDGKIGLGTIAEAMVDSYVASQLVQETMMSSEFATLLGSTQDRVLLAKYALYEPDYKKFLLATRRVRDFRTVGSARRHGGKGLSAVAEGETFPQEGLTESTYSYGVAKYGMTYSLTFEDIINDDLDAFASLPEDMADDAIQEEMAYASALYVANATLFSDSHSGGDGNTYDNKLTPALTATNLKTAWNTMVKFPGDVTTEGTGKPLNNTPTYLVVPPALKLAAMEILGSMNIVYAGGDSQTGISAVAYPSGNVMQGMLILCVDPYIPVNDATNGHTSWYLFSDPRRGLHAAEMAFLRGFESPQLFRRNAGATPEGMGESFSNDSLAWKVRHIFGGSQAAAAGNWRGCLWSNGTT